jgi:hypothetical protein
VNQHLVDDDGLDLRGAALAPRRDVDPDALAAEAGRRRRRARRSAAAVAVLAVASVGTAGALVLGPGLAREEPDGRVALQPSTTTDAPSDGALPTCVEAAAPVAPRTVYLPCDDGRTVAPVERGGATDLAGAAAALSEGASDEEGERGWVDLVDGTVTAEQRADRVLVDVALDGASGSAAPQLRQVLLATVQAWTGAGEDAVVFTVDGSCGGWESLTGTPCEAPAGGAPPAPTGCATAPELPACTPGEGEGG